MGYENSRVAVDAVMFTIMDGELSVYLSRREKEPFKDLLELPGGLLAKEETAEGTLHRKLKGIAGKDIFFEQFYTFTEPGRDPRERAISIGFIALVENERAKDLHSWHKVSKLGTIAFDHKKIIEKAKDHLQKNISPRLVKHMLSSEFPLNALQRVYEAIEGISYDNRNFRKKMKSFVEETLEREEKVSHRPAKLYRIV